MSKYITGSHQWLTILPKQKTVCIFLTIWYNSIPNRVCHKQAGLSVPHWNVPSSASLHWRHNDHHGVSNHQPHGCLLNRLFRCRSGKTSKLRVTGLCVGNSPGLVNSPHKGPVTRKNVSIWWRHHIGWISCYSVMGDVNWLLQTLDRGLNFQT